MKRIGMLITIIPLLSFLYGCGEIEFEPSVVPLELGTIDPAQMPEEIVPTQSSHGELQEGGGQQEPLRTIEPVAGLDSEQALRICTEALSWGGADRGACLLPGGTHYYFWMTPDVIIEVEINTSDPNQMGFLQATDRRAGSKEDLSEDARLAIVLSAVFFAEIPLTLFACATVVSCALGGTVIVGTGYGISELGDSIVEEFQAIEKATQQTRYYYCRIQGNSDPACRDALDMHSPEPGGTNE